MNYMSKSLTISELLSLSWQEIKARFVPFFLLALCTPFVGWLLNGLLLSFDPLLLQTMQQENPLLSILANFISGLFGLWFTAAFVLFVCKRTGSIRELLMLALSRVPRLFLGFLLYALFVICCFVLVFLLGWSIYLLFGAESALTGILIALLAIATVVGLLVLFVYLVLFPYVLILTNVPVLRSFGYAYSLVKNRFWYTLGLLVLLMLICLGVALLLLLVFGITSLVLWMLFPVFRYIFGLLTIVTTALLNILYQVPLLAVYVDRSSRPVTQPADNPAPIE